MEGMPMTMISKGKKPISEKPVANTSQYPVIDPFGDRMRLDPALIKEITDQGLEYRFLDAKDLQESGGYHPRGWMAYTRKGAPMATEFKVGTDPAGIIRRGTCVLGVRPVETGDRHRAELKRRLAVYNRVSRQGSSGKSEELEVAAKKAGAKVLAGYDE